MCGWSQNFKQRYIWTQSHSLLENVFYIEYYSSDFHVLARGLTSSLAYIRVVFHRRSKKGTKHIYTRNRFCSKSGNSSVARREREKPAAPPTCVSISKGDCQRRVVKEAEIEGICWFAYTYYSKTGSREITVRACCLIRDFFFRSFLPASLVSTASSPPFLHSS